MEAVVQRMKAERGRKAAQYRAEGDSEAAAIRHLANEESEKILIDAEAKATALRGEGDAAAAKHYEAFSQNPDLAEFLVKVETLGKVKKNSTVILDTATPPFDLLSGKTKIPRLNAEAASPAGAPDDQADN